ncbi:GNAT family N-acetyltransferase, partial [Pseudomonas sp. MWU12-2534b]
WGGFEAYGEDGLLRSMVVSPDHRSKGVGSATLKIIERFTADRRVTRLHLLTTSASSFFGQHGYEVRQRGAEPLLISQTRQFRDLCPASAFYMYKSL